MLCSSRSFFFFFKLNKYNGFLASTFKEICRECKLCDELEMKLFALLNLEQARKALRALRGLVKLQALARGYLVRRQANAPLKRMHALSRAQATARSQRSPHRPLLDNTTHHRSRSRKSMVRLHHMWKILYFHSCRLEFVRSVD